jgi:3-phosphoshikimate 1-carboxyvinyltransferase
VAILRVFPTKTLKGTLRPPGDKSISHRALMLGVLAVGETRLQGLLQAEDVASTARCLKEIAV